MRRRALLAVLAGLLAGPAFAATDMLTSSGTLVTAASSCPSVTTGPSGKAACSSGWFRIAGAKTVLVHVWETTGSGTATVLLKQRLDSGDGTWTLKTWTNPASTEIAIAVDPPGGEIEIDVTAIGSSGRIKAKIEAILPNGDRLW